MANRVVVQADVDNALYVDWLRDEGLPPMQVGDIILDTYTNPGPTFGVFYNSATTWGSINLSEVREGATIYLDSTTFNDEISYISLAGNGSAPFSTTAANPCTVRPLLGQVKFVRNATEGANRCVEFKDIPHIVIDGECNSYPGLRDGWGSFRWDRFGFWITDPQYGKNTRMCVVDGVNIKTIVFRGICVFHGFSAFRAMRTNENQEVDSILLERCLAAFAIEGEGTYLNQTTDNAANPIFGKAIIRDFLSVLRAAEGIQINNISSRVGDGYLSNFVVYGSAFRWLDAFQDNQDTGIQYELQDGGNQIRNFIMDGWGSIGLHIFSSDKTARGYLPLGKVCKVRDFWMGNGRQVQFRKHGTSQFGDPIEVRDGDFGFINDTIGETNNDPVYPYYVESADDTVPMHFINCTFRTEKAEIFASTGTSNNHNATFTHGLVRNNTVPEPQYIQSGFDGINVEQIELWTPTALQNGGLPTSYKIDDVVANPVVGVGYTFHKCIQAHTTGAGITTRPDQDLTKWVDLKWSLTTGLRSDQVGWNAGDPQSDLPPIDLRLVEGSYHNVRNRGLSCNPQDPTKTRYNVRWTEEDTGSPGNPDLTVIKTIPGIRTTDIVIEDYSYLRPGRFVQFEIITTDNQVTRSSWLQIA